MLKNFVKTSAIALTILGFTVISGCASNTPLTPISQINANRDSYLRNNFGVENLPPKVSASIPSSSDKDLLPFRLITIQQKSETESNDGKKLSGDSATKIYNIGGGLTQSMRTTSVNDIPLEYSFDTKYRNTYTLSYQSANQSKQYSGPLVQVKEIKQIDALPKKLAEKSTYIFDVVMLSKFNGRTYNSKIECKTDKYYPASTLHKNIEGSAIDMQCGHYYETTLSGFDNWVYLEKYGISIHGGKKDKEGKTVKTIQSFVVE